MAVNGQRRLEEEEMDICLGGSLELYDNTWSLFEFEIVIPIIPGLAVG